MFPSLGFLFAQHLRPDGPTGSYASVGAIRGSKAGLRLPFSQLGQGTGQGTPGLHCSPA